MIVIKSLFVVVVTTLISDLHELTASLAAKFLQPHLVPRLEAGDVLSDQQIADLRLALGESDSLLPVASVDFGAGARIFLGKVKIDLDVLNNCQTRCVRYLVVLVKNLLEILPEQSGRLEAARYFTPQEALLQDSRADVLQLPSAPGVHTDQLKQEWDRLPRVNWLAFFKGEIPKISSEFWQGVVQYDRLGVEPKFQTLTTLAFRTLCSLLANADVERAFSFMNQNKAEEPHERPAPGGRYAN
ncbi:LOW QUALITY PROTEIN: Toll-like receptor 3 [Frankliniella fusca]|uniref:Toll-like receptor 3 n=1 Tax=Frankliniella fusca TaxID=407009 RepID=A0AAE1H472_9NEOP|nr:LOW QUALITY PROTEIN: Toll-like receptor 3 [Frankliniella fusca]